MLSTAFWFASWAECSVSHRRTDEMAFVCKAQTKCGIPKSQIYPIRKIERSAPITPSKADGVELVTSNPSELQKSPRLRCSQPQQGASSRPPLAQAFMRLTRKDRPMP